MTLQTLSAWLRCPKCSLDLNARGPLVLGCETGHRFDINRRGFATLLEDGRGFIGDDSTMLNARAELLGSGAYDPLVRSVVEHATKDANRRSRVLDAGCGTGHYLDSVLGALNLATGSSGDVRALAMDISPAAVRQTLRHVGRDRADGLVANTWSPLPIRDGAADIVLNVFSPRNSREFARVLSPDGLLVVAVPQPEHLVELRTQGGMLTVPAAKDEHVRQKLEGDFTQIASSAVRYVLEPAPNLALALRQMGPSARHIPQSGTPTPPSSVTVAVDVLSFAPRT